MTRMRRLLAFAVAAFVAFVLGGRGVGADCTPERNAPSVVFVGRAPRD